MAILSSLLSFESIRADHEPINDAALIAESGQVKAAIDMGSGRIKITVAKIVNGRIADVLYTRGETCKFAEDLARNVKNGNNELSQNIQSIAMKILFNFKEEANAYGAEDIAGIATEVFRQSDNGMAFLSRINSELGLRFKIISQEEEAKLGFATVVQHFPISEDKLIAWDCGSGSFQISLKNIGGEIISYQGVLGTTPTTVALIEDIQNKSFNVNQTSNPVSLSDALKLVDKIRSMLQEPPELHKFRIADVETKIVGIGHGTSSFGVCAIATGKTEFTAEELWEGIEPLLNLTDEELKKRGFQNTTASSVLPRLLLVYATMTKLEIKKLTWLEVNGSTDGMLTTPSFWEK